MRATTQPPIKMTASDTEGLWSLAKSNLRGNPELTSFLVDEIARATLVEPERTRNVVTMNSWVEFYYGLDRSNSKGPAGLSGRGRYYKRQNLSNDTDRCSSHRTLGGTVHRMAHVGRQ